MSSDSCCGCAKAQEPPPAASCGCGGGATVMPPGAGFWARGGWLLPALGLGLLLNAGLQPLSLWVTAQVLHLDPAGRLGSAVAFFVYDAPKVLLLLAEVTFLVGFLQSFLSPERIRERLEEGRSLAVGVVGKVWPYILLGIGVGGFIHGYVPEGVLATLMGKGSWWTVPFAVLVGVPIYASTAVILPIVQSLLAKGAALGTVLAFMMAVTALSLPETIILRRVLKPRLIGVFLGIASAGILAVGYLFNLIL